MKTKFRTFYVVAGRGISNRELAAYAGAFVVTFLVVFIGLVWAVWE